MVEFGLDDLDQDKDNDSFFLNATEGRQLHEGSNQKLYWTNESVITVFDANGQIVGRHYKPKGQAILPRGLSVSFASGKVKKED
ncbi:hypothetical protein H9L39_19314 [Fusarium oxysporum f. sp. albedinis]|nr:hypothetical protein H9L39_19314 [Fusarium oxysporum f. sp. albedinis]